MRVSLFAALVLCLCALAPARAQIPRDPVTSPPPAKAAAPGTQAAPQIPAPFVTRLSDVEIPFTVRAGATPQSQPSAVRVFVSWDRGKTWHFYEELRPDAGRFRFRARQDGEFWFATQTIDRGGQPDSSQPRSPQLRLIIDAQKPQLVVKTEVDESGNVHLVWSAADTSLRAESLKIEYQDTTGVGAWEAVETRAGASANSALQLGGQTTFHPNVISRVINVRAEIADAAGNVAYFSQRLPLIPTRPKGSEGLSLGPAADPSATPWPAAGAQPGNQIAGQQPAPAVTGNSFVGPGRMTSSATPRPREELPAPSRSGSARTSEEMLPPIGPLESPGRPSPETLPSFAPPESLDTPAGQQPRLTNSRRFSLDYDVQTVGPEGLAAVELWGTTDGGRTWMKWGTDPDKASPFDVEVNHEAIYGFRIVIVGKNGLATSTPQSGDAADIWVTTDLTRPQAHLTGATYGQGAAAGKLDIRWEASDANLGSRPVTLAMADRPDGPFTPIAAGLPNTGQYYWEYDPRSPRQIYLRLEVRDEAGNIAIDQLTEPIRVEGLEPKGRIRNFNPGPEAIQGAFRPPLFR
jgi:hypothetical protein